MDGVLPVLVEVGVLASYIIVHYGRVPNRLKKLALVGIMVRFILGGTTHPLHVHDVLRVRILMLPQFQHFEFLPHRRIVLLVINNAERAQRLFRHTVFLGVREALVVFNLGESLLFFETELDV